MILKNNYGNKGISVVEYMYIWVGPKELYMKRVSLSLVALGAALSIGLMSCETTKVEEQNPYSTDWFEIEMADPEDSGYFYTGDPLNPLYSSMSMLEAEFKKTSGYSKAGFGYIFAFSEPSKVGIVDNYIRFEINTDGEYALYRVNGKTFTDLVEPNEENTAYFYEATCINAGYDAVNNLKLVLNSNDTYSIFCNGVSIAKDITRYEGATYGVQMFFSVAQKEQENLPEETVKIAYRLVDGSVYVPGVTPIVDEVVEKVYVDPDLEK